MICRNGHNWKLRFSPIFVYVLCSFALFLHLFYICQTTHTDLFFIVVCLNCLNCLLNEKWCEYVCNVSMVCFKAVFRNMLNQEYFSIRLYGHIVVSSLSWNPAIQMCSAYNSVYWLRVDTSCAVSQCYPSTNYECNIYLKSN